MTCQSISSTDGYMHLVMNNPDIQYLLRLIPLLFGMDLCRHAYRQDPSSFHPVLFLLC